jgi:hypothetical protein
VIAAVVLGVIVAFAGLCALAYLLTDRNKLSARQVRREVKYLQKVLDHYEEFTLYLRANAWQHRESEPFAEIVLDEIRKFEKRAREIS